MPMYRLWKSATGASSSSGSAHQHAASLHAHAHAVAAPGGSDSNAEHTFVLQVRNLDAEYGTSATLNVTVSDGDALSVQESPRAAPTPRKEERRLRSLSMGGLLRLFRSEFFDAYMAVTYLYRYRTNPGVQDFLCNELYGLRDADMEDYLPQLCSLLLHHVEFPKTLEMFLFDRCSKSMQIALQVYWFLQSATDDAIAAKNTASEISRRRLRTMCEVAAVNGDDAAIYEKLVQRSLRTSESASVSVHVHAEEQHVIALPSSEEASSALVSSAVARIDCLELSETVDHSSSGEASDTFAVEQGPAVLNGDADSHDQNAHAPIPLQGDGTAPPCPASPVAYTASESNGPEILLAIKQERFDYFNDILSLIKAFVKLSLRLRDVPSAEREAACHVGLAECNMLLLRRMAGMSTSAVSPFDQDHPPPDADAVAAMGESAAKRALHLPLARANDPALRILRIAEKETIVLSTKTKAPYMVFAEVYKSQMPCHDKHIFCEHLFAAEDGCGCSNETSDVAGPDDASEEEEAVHASSLIEKQPSGVEESDMSTTGLAESTKSLGESSRSDSAAHQASATTPASFQKLADPAILVREHVKKSVYGRKTGESVLARVDEMPDDEDADAFLAKRHAMQFVVYGELWEDRERRVLASSPFGKLPNVHLSAFIVKAGDDLRQEQLAIQLIRQFEWIFKEENVDVFVRPFSIMCVNADAGLVELVPNSASLHNVKKKTPHFTSLRNYFERTYGAPSTKSFRVALRNFVSSMAAYSLICYFLQIKDRHNGNLMLDTDGHLVHIDFGFMLSNSPGAIKFETAPFKLTDELLEVMGGERSPSYLYFKELVVLGFLAARKHSEKVVALVEILLESNSVMPCMQGGSVLLDQLRSRFLVSCTEHECIRSVLALIDESCNNWRSKQYDKFQNWTNGIY
ncbi:Phosphatidylinositol 4-kinase [Porphyridium purpureum]|uniref:1-phosphatidylinositol 4-kinase n=1 Tax=Porphyridium purpureum TaxID=35688 RepID=A0A5J4YK21_PORPP|nr:Phosphatidylinositol 4-kinase [Porphyridium purpureum]|eukprot:POR8001..scf210_14